MPHAGNGEGKRGGPRRRKVESCLVERATYCPSAEAERKFRLPLLPRDPRRPRPTKKWTSLLKTAAKFCDESVESDHATMELDPPVEKTFISATIADDDEGGWEVLVLGYEWRRGRPKFKYIIIERENDKDSNPHTKTATRGGGGAVDGFQD